jgi:5-hydroxyisourate hydrolase
MGVSTHVLDTSRGRPAGGIAVTLERRVGEGWVTAGTGETDADGRVKTLLADGAPTVPGAWRLRFDVRPYFARLGVEAFYPVVEITFTMAAAQEHHHVPLLLSPFGFTTYRGT